MTRVDVSGFALNTRVDGADGAPWVVLANSLGSNLGMWDAQIPFLTTRFRVLRFDHRGHGASDVPPGPYTFEQLADDVVALMDHFGIERAAFMGLSMGGMTGMGLAIDHPDRVTRVVCADARADAPEPFLNMWEDRLAKIAAGGTDAIADATVATWLTEDFRAANPEEAARLRGMIAATEDAGYIACVGALKKLDYLRRLGGVSVPVLYVGGSADPGAPPAVMQAMADATPGGRFVEIAGAAHVANVNRPDAFNDAVAQFLGIR